MRHRHLFYHCRIPAAKRRNPTLSFLQSSPPILRRHVEPDFHNRITRSAMPPLQRPRVVIITGPTSVGKSATALELAKHVNGEIVSADSVQLYKFLNVGSNKATPAERARVPHHLIDVADPLDEFTAGDFYRRARAATDDILKRGKVPVIVGGTMMYVRWFIHGRPATPPAAQAARQRVEEAIHACNGDWDTGIALLATRDPKRAQMLLRNDWYRLTRALEVFETTGVPMTDMPLVGGAPKAVDGSRDGSLDYDFRCVFLVGDRRAMNRRIDRRCEEMILPERLMEGSFDCDHSCEFDPLCGDIADSILTEVSSLLTASRLRVAAASPCLAIGYRQTIAYLINRALAHMEGLGEDEERAKDAFRLYVEEFQQATRSYGKQQIAWFRKESMFRWVTAGRGSVDEIADILQRSNSNYQQFCERTSAAQATMKDGMIAQGKLMKTYISKRTWLVKDSEAERRAVQIGETCARQMANKLTLSNLKSMIEVVSR